MSITIKRGDILTAQTDAIVNPANSHLRHAGGLAAIIDRAATGKTVGVYSGDQREPQIPATARGIQWREDHTNAPLVATGNAYATSAGNLPHKHVIHAVGPVWNGGDFCEGELLFSAHMAALRVAQEQRCESIAIPAISAGVFGYPVDLAAPIALEACIFTQLHVEFWLFEDSHAEAYHKAYADLTAQLALAQERS